MVKKTWILFAAFGVAIGDAAPSLAATLHYTTDSFSDGVTGDIIGGPNSAFELYGLGYTQVGSTLYVGLNTNLPVGGQPTPGVTGGSVAWGDLFLNFSDQPFASAVDAGKVYGVRFDPANDSPLPQLGVYRVQATGSVTPTNSGFGSLDEYQQVVIQAGGVPLLGDRPFDGSYLSNSGLPQNIIAQGTLLSDQVAFIDDFATVGFTSDFGFSAALAETGLYTYGFSFDTSDLPSEDFIAHLLAECVNDSLLFEGTIVAQAPPPPPESVPEPTVGLPLLGLAVAYGIQQSTRRPERAKE